MHSLKFLQTLLMIMVFSFVHVHAADTEIGRQGTVPEDELTLEKKWGITVKGVRLTAAGHMLDFRYRVTDPNEASTLLHKQSNAYLIDQKTGQKLSVPRTRLGPLRQTAVRPVPNRDYIILFSNPMGMVKPGDLVTVIIGDFRAENLKVE